MIGLFHFVVFFAMVSVSFYQLFSRPSYFKTVYGRKVLVNGREKFILLTVLFSMVITGGINLGLNGGALRIFLWIMFIFLAYIQFKKIGKLNHATFIMAYFFLVWLMITSLYSENYFIALRVYLKFLFPFIFMFFAYFFVKSEDFIYVLFRWILFTGLVLSILLGGFMSNVLNIWIFYFYGLMQPMAAIQDFLSLVSGIALIMWFRTKETKYIVFFIWLLSSAVFAETRTAILSTIGVIVVAYYLKKRLKAIPVILSILVLALSMIFFIPSLKEKTFYNSDNIEQISDLSSLSQDNVNTSARSVVWEYLLDHYFIGHEFFGSGLGTVQSALDKRLLFGGINAAHSDYVVILCDIGLAGLAIYLLFIFAVFYKANSIIKKRFADDSLVDSAYAVILSFVAVLITMGFNNVLNTSWPNAIAFIFVGIMLKNHDIRRRKNLCSV